MSAHNNQTTTISSHPARERMLNLGKMRPARNEPVKSRPSVHPAVKRFTEFGKRQPQNDEIHPAIARFERIKAP